MEYEQILTFQGYAKAIFTIIVFIVFYSWVYSLYKRDRSGEKDYESYSKLALNDSFDSVPLEPKDNNKKEKIV